MAIVAQLEDSCTRRNPAFSAALPRIVEAIEAEWRRSVALRSWRPADVERQILLRDAHTALGRLMEMDRGE